MEKLILINGSGVSGASGSELPMSNAKAILCMGTVYFDQGGDRDDRLLKAYCLDLWNASHKVKAEVSEIYQCQGCKEIKIINAMMKKVKNAKGPNGRSYGLLDGIKVQK